ncbi:DinB family protein [Fibrisoma montanum]|uniref:DinB family protein n=1 Tax=Fibrisoma montanum TaxID=2305895 RepID=A0A418LX60_9BACT|nr:DinB family protein [Fibrisoma montanum]RIV17796.1 DinB family protein [Fibrisoma montanum]
MNLTEPTTALTDALQAITALLDTLSTDDLHRSQGTRWTIAQEMEHLRKSTQGTAFLLSPASRPKWYPYTGESRTYETVVAQYQSALAASAPVNNAATRPTDEIASLTADQQKDAWNTVVQQLLASVGQLTEADLDTFTVWKHPLLGPLTVREMIYFTTHHTEHHHASLVRKHSTTATV